MRLILPVLLLSLLSPGLAAETVEEKGLAIAVEADRRDSGFQGSMAELTMILRNPHGQESIREIRSKTLEVDGDGDRDKSLIIFDRPEDVGYDRGRARIFLLKT